MTLHLLSIFTFSKNKTFFASDVLLKCDSGDEGEHVASEVFNFKASFNMTDTLTLKYTEYFLLTCDIFILISLSCILCYFCKKGFVQKRISFLRVKLAGSTR